MDNLNLNLLLTAIVPPLLALVGKLFADRDPGAIRRMRRHAKLAAEMPKDSPAEGHLNRLLEAETGRYADEFIKKATRKINGTNLAAMIFVAVIVAGLTYLITLGALVFWPLYFVSGGLALFGVLFILIGGLPNLYKHETEEEKATREAEKAVKKAAKEPDADGK